MRRLAAALLALPLLLVPGCTDPTDPPRVAQHSAALATWTGGDLVFPANAPGIVTIEQSTEDRFEAHILQMRGAQGKNATDDEPGQTGGETNTMGGKGGDGSPTQPAGLGGRNVMMSGPAGADNGGGGAESGIAEITCAPATGNHSGCRGVFIGVEGVPEKPEVIQLGGPATGVPFQFFPGTFLIDGASSVVMHSRQFAFYAGDADRLIFSTDNTAAHIFFGSAEAKAVFPGEAEFDSGISTRRRAVADQDTDILPTDHIIGFTALTASHTARLPPAPTFDGGHVPEWQIKDESGSASDETAIYVCAPSGYTVDGQGCVAVQVAFGKVAVYATSNGYFTE